MKVVAEIKGLPKCAVTGFPQHLGEGQPWNQIVYHLRTSRSNYCYHCHCLMDHRLSVRDLMWLVWEGLNPTLRVVFIVFAALHDGGNGEAAPQPRQPDE